MASTDSGDSSDSIHDHPTTKKWHDARIKLGNVSNCYVTPPGYNGPFKKGHLKFDAEFECGEFI